MNNDDERNKISSLNMIDRYIMLPDKRHKNDKEESKSGESNVK